MKNSRRWFSLALLLLSFPLVGVASKDILGVGCGGCGGPPPPAAGAPPDGGGDQLPGGGGVAASLTYSLDRSDIGKSYGGPESAKGTYKISATFGNYLSQGRTLTDKYMIHHPMGREIVSAASALRAKNNGKSELNPETQPAEPVPSLEDQPAEEKPAE